MSTPLADRIRPRSLEEMVGQEHLLGEEALLRRIAQGKNIPNMIFYGPSGVGKTTAARIIAASAGKKLERLNETETALDKLEGMLDNYLVKLTDHPLSSEESMWVSEMLHTLSDFERIGDYAVNVSECACVLHDRNLAFSPQAQGEMDCLCAAVDETLEKTLACYKTRHRVDAVQVEPLEEVVDLIADTLKSRHVERLKQGECTIELGTQFLELLINLERISDHCSNVALRIIRQTASKDDMIRIDSHTYVQDLHHGADHEFDQLFAQYREKYYKPIEAVQKI